jgi:hypothetical protein
VIELSEFYLVVDGTHEGALGMATRKRVGHVELLLNRGGNGGPIEFVEGYVQYLGETNELIDLFQEFADGKPMAELGEFAEDKLRAIGLVMVKNLKMSIGATAALYKAADEQQKRRAEAQAPPMDERN